MAVFKNHDIYKTNLKGEGQLNTLEMKMKCLQIVIENNMNFA